MKVRRDGEATRRRILDAALEVFGEKGYHDATHAEICARAGVNTSAVNYHFSSKENLYRATWEHAARAVESLYPLGGGLGPEALPCNRLRAQVQAILDRVMDPRLGHIHNLRMMEMANPTGFLHDFFVRWLEENRRLTLSILGDLLGPRATQEDLELCELSVISQCRAVHKTCPPPKDSQGPRGPSLPWRFNAADSERLTAHITSFSLAGIAAVRQQIEARS